MVSMDARDRGVLGSWKMEESGVVDDGGREGGTEDESV